MDPFRRHDVALARQKTAGQKLAEALEMMRTGIHLKRVALRRAHPAASEQDLDAMVQAWLEADD